MRDYNFTSWLGAGLPESHTMSYSAWSVTPVKSTQTLHVLFGNAYAASTGQVAQLITLFQFVYKQISINLFTDQYIAILMN